REVVLSWNDPAKGGVEPGTFSLVSYKVDATNSEPFTRRHALSDGRFFSLVRQNALCRES
ncbi:hypothetical protein ACWECY_25235, partial [Streptomyces microflavus]